MREMAAPGPQLANHEAVASIELAQKGCCVGRTKEGVRFHLHHPVDGGWKMDGELVPEGRGEKDEVRGRGRDGRGREERGRGWEGMGGS